MKAIQLTWGIAEITSGCVVGAITGTLFVKGWINNDNPNDTDSDKCAKYILTLVGSYIAGSMLGDGCKNIITSFKK